VAKLIKILAASVGGGLVLGAGIRLGEAIATWDPDSPPPTQKLARRLGQLETRLQSLEGEGAGVSSRVDAQANAMSAVKSQIKTENQHVEALNETSVRLRGELQSWLEESVSTHMAEVEARLKAESERGQKQMLDVFVENVQTRVIQRISQLEEEVAGQSAAMNELRECSLRTERSIQKLLGGLDRLVVRQSDPPKLDPVKEEGTSAAPALRPAAPTFVEPPARPYRWKIFG
jgi:uncharacterized coiled-coil protein SlyX